MTNLLNKIILKAAGISAEHPLVGVISGRSGTFELTESTHNAALRPDPTGGISHAERAALACRIARLNNEDDLARHFDGMISGNVDSESDRLTTDPHFKGADNIRLQAIIRHTDLVAVDPKATTANDISALVSAGISEEDIVRLSELIAFVSYLIRVVAGLRLMAQVA